MSDLKDQILNEVQGLRELIQKIDCEMEPLLQEKAACMKQLRGLEAYLMVVAPESVQNQYTQKNNPPTSIDLIERVLERAGKPLKNGDILQRLKDEEGYEVPGENPTSNLGSKLAGSPRFKRFGVGLYGLKHWE